MRTAAGVTIGAILMWIILAIWAGPARWLLTRIPPITPPDHVDRVRVWAQGVEQDGAAWPV